MNRLIRPDSRIASIYIHLDHPKLQSVCYLCSLSNWISFGSLATYFNVHIIENRRCPNRPLHHKSSWIEKKTSVVLLFYISQKLFVIVYFYRSVSLWEFSKDFHVPNWTLNFFQADYWVECVQLFEIIIFPLSLFLSRSLPLNSPIIHLFFLFAPRERKIFLTQFQANLFMKPFPFVFFCSSIDFFYGKLTGSGSFTGFMASSFAFLSRFT